jgi:hypothetical protein
LEEFSAQAVVWVKRPGAEMGGVLAGECLACEKPSARKWTYISGNMSTYGLLPIRTVSELARGFDPWK